MKAIDRLEIDAWDIAKSGLSERVANCCNRQGVESVGDLRRIDEATLLSWRNFGVGSAREVEEFFSACRQLERGADKFDSIYGVLKYFLSESELFVLNNRYGLDRAEPGASRNYYTLQHIANKRGLTRERVRQVQDQALERLSSHIVVSFLDKFCGRIVRRIDRAGGILACESIYSWKDEIFKHLNPCATTLLLSDLADSGFIYKYNNFTTMSESDIDNFYKSLIRKLASLPKPVPLSQISGEIGLVEISSMLKDVNHLLFTDDGRVIYSLKSLEAFIYEVLGGNSDKFHYKELDLWLKEHLDPQTRKGHGYWLHKLLEIDSFKRHGFGVYEPLGR